jgi:hypothetical protein
MQKVDIEKSFNRAFFLSFSKKKGFFVFPILVLCGILIVFCRSIAYESSGWIAMSMIFLPIFLSSGILLALGVLLTRIYSHEVKNVQMNYRRILSSSWDVLVGSSYLSLPVIVVYLFLWIILGIFLLLKEIPHIGSFIGVILSFAPFLIILSSILLAVFILGLLFFVSPRIGFSSIKKRFKIPDFFSSMKKHLFSYLLYFFIAMIPIMFVVIVLTLAAVVTKVSYTTDNQTLSVALRWFFIMIPFCGFLTPAVIFFFNFAAESHNNITKQEKNAK